MRHDRIRLLACLALAAAIPAVPARADDCGPVKEAMLGAAQKPHTSTVTRERNGQTVVQHVVQTKDGKYLEMDGKWISMPFTAKDVAEVQERLDAATMTCTRVGSGEIAGTPATVYTAQVVDEDKDTSDSKLWIGRGGQLLQTETRIEGQTLATVLDYAHVDAPPNAVPLADYVQQRARRH